MTAVNPVPRRSASKKRHTKPCKFYQLKQCPLSAEVCDFAHIPAPDEPPALPTHRRKLCRYYAAGNCTDGANCRFRHGPDGTEDGRRPSGNKKADPPPRKDSLIIPPYPEASELIGNDYTSGLERGPFVGPLYPLTPGYVSWAPYGIPVPAYPCGTNSPEDSTVNLTSPTATSSSGSAASVCSPSGSSSSMMDEGVVDYVMSIQSKAADTSSPNTPVNPNVIRTPTVTTPSSYFPEHARWPPKSHNRPIRSQSLSNLPSTRHKQSYKTKPCKYYKVDNTCPKGDLCTFIHDVKASASAADSRSSTAPNSPDSMPAEQQSESSETQATSKLQHGLPEKPITLREEKKKKGFYPISWRVIGGGVMIGGKPRGLSPGSDEPRTKQIDTAKAATLSSNHVSLSVNTAGSPGSRLPDSVQGQADLSKKVPPRGRSKSISATPTSERVDVLTLFSAESPGGL